MTLARPHKFLDAAELETWIGGHHPGIFAEWEYSDAVEWVDFWDWLDWEYTDVLSEFEDWFCREKREERLEILGGEK